MRRDKDAMIIGTPKPVRLVFRTTEFLGAGLFLVALTLAAFGYPPV